MSISASMQIGMNGLNIFRSATAVISQNIANVSTPGYSRQKAIIESAPTTNLSGFTLGSGAMITSIERFHDALLHRQTANSETTLGYNSTKSMALQQIEPAFNDIGVDGVGAALAHFFAAWQDLTNNPGGIAERQGVLSNAQLLADEIHSSSKTLTDLISLQNISLTPTIDDINIKLKEIARLNGQVTATEMVTGNANEVKDKRDLLLLQLSKQIGITITENGDGTTDVKLVNSGEALVTGANVGVFSLDKTTDPNSYKVQLIQVGGTQATISNPVLYTGSLGATLDLRDTIIPGYLTKLDDLATTLATDINTQHKLGFDLNAVAGIDFFNPSKTKAGDLTNGSNVVSNVDVTGLWVGMQVDNANITGGTALIGSINLTGSFTLVDSNNVAVNATATAPASTITFPNGTASALFSINPAMSTYTVAASSQNSNAGDNINAVKIAGLATQRRMSGTPPTLTFSGYWDAFVSKMGLDVNSSKTNVAQDEAFNNQLKILKDSTSGVSLDQELSDMMMYQRSYQACAQVISTATAMMDILLGIVR